MLRDYCPKKKPDKIQHKSFTPKVNLFFSVALSLITIILFIFALKIEFSKLYQLKEDRRILLLKEQQLVAILFFNAASKQLILTDLRNESFDLSVLKKEATISTELKKNLVYAFLLNTAFDQSYAYDGDDLSREQLLLFFKKYRIYYSFLKNHETLWIEEKFKQDTDQSFLAPIFDCPVALINTTGEVGLASSLAKILETSAFSIIKKDSNTQNLAYTQIFYNPEEKSCTQLLARLNQFFPQNVSSISQNETSNHRAAMVIYIGRDLADLYVFFVNFFHSQI